MASYIQTAATCGVFTPYVDSKKGDISNRTRCAGEHFKNNAAAIAQDAVVIGGTAAGVAVAAKKGDKIAEFAKNTFGKAQKIIKSTFGKGKAKAKEVIQKVTDKVPENLKNNKIVNKATDAVENTVKKASKSKKYKKLVKDMHANLNKAKKTLKMDKIKKVAKSKTGKTLLENPTLKNNNVIKKTLKTNKGGKIKNFIKSAFEKFSKLPKTNKYLAVAVAALGALGLGYVTTKHSYQAGQIDQKYTDEARIEERQREFYL